MNESLISKSPHYKEFSSSEPGFTPIDYDSMVSFFNHTLSLEGSTNRQELFQRVSSGKKGIFLLKPKYIKEIIQSHRKIGFLDWHVPHTQVYTLPREDFLKITKYEMPDVYYGIENREQLPEIIVILGEPSAKDLSRYKIDYFLYQFWALLFHAEIHKLQLQWEQAYIHKDMSINSFIEELGRDRFEEIRFVLKEENLLFHPEDNREVFYEFVAYYLQLYYFAPACIHNIFPLLQQPEIIWKKITCLGIDPRKHLQNSRPEGYSEVEFLISYSNSLLEGVHPSVFTLVTKEFREISSWSGFARFEMTPEEMDNNSLPVLLDLAKEEFYASTGHKQLRFRDLWNKVLNGELAFNRTQLLALDDFCTVKMADFYQPATATERLFLTNYYLCDPQERNKRAQRALATLEKCQNKYHDVRMLSFWQRLLLAPLWLLVQIVLLPQTLLQMVAQAFAYHYSWAEKLYNQVFIKTFCRSFTRARQHEERGNLAKAFLEFKKAWAMIRHLRKRANHQQPHPLEEELQEKLNGYFQEIEAHFVQEHVLSEQEATTLHELLEKLGGKERLCNSERKFLVDIQKSYIDPRKEYFVLNIGGWLLSFGKKAWRKPLPLIPHLKKLKALKSLEKRSYRLPLEVEEIHHFQELFASALHREEQRIRHDFGKLLEQNLETVGIRSAQQGELSYHEKIAADRIREEILDLLVEKGYVRFTDLRDVISRNELKLEDLSGPAEWLRGDQLLRLDQKVTSTLQGGHRRAEIYMRWIHRLGAALFGSSYGRWFFKYLLVPFGGAFVLKETLYYVLKENFKIFWQPLHSVLHPLYQFYQITPQGPILTDFAWVLVTGLAILFFFYTQIGKALAKEFFSRVFSSLKMVFLKAPKGLWHSSPVQYLYRLQFWRFCYIFIIRPGLYSLPPSLSLIYFTEITKQIPASLIMLFWLCLLNLIINSPIGREVFGHLEDLVIRGVLRINRTVFIGLYRVTIEFFQGFLQIVESVLYAIDDFLRFRKGDRLSIQIVKTFLSRIWRGINYIFRFTINLIVEPQINPIKHFPVVTISHKILIPLSPYLTSSSKSILEPIMGDWLWLGMGLVFLFIQFGLPGICGFMAWEFRENWRLYKHATPTKVTPVIVGSHGESVSSLLRLGFHSGTVPKLYRKIRRASSPFQKGNSRNHLRKLEHQHHHIRLYLHKFVERYFISQYQYQPDLKHEAIQIQALQPHIYHQKIVLPIFLETGQGQICFTINYQFEGELLQGRVSEEAVGFFSPEIQKYFELTMLAFWKRSAVDILPEQAAEKIKQELSLTPEHRLRFQQREKALITQIYSSHSLALQGEISFPLDYPHVRPRVLLAPPASDWKPLGKKRDELMIRYREVLWQEYEQQFQASCRERKVQ